MLKVTKLTFKSVTDSKGRKCNMPVATIEFDSYRRVKAARCDVATRSAEDIAKTLEQAINR